METLNRFDINTIEVDENITTSEKETIIKSTVVQGKYREKLLEECPFCQIRMVNDERLLIASHIKHVFNLIILKKQTLKIVLC